MLNGTPPPTLKTRQYQSCIFRIWNLTKMGLFWSLPNFNFPLDDFAKARCSWKKPLLDRSCHQVPTFRSSKVVSSQGGHPVNTKDAMPNASNWVGCCALKSNQSFRQWLGGRFDEVHRSIYLSRVVLISYERLFFHPIHFKSNHRTSNHPRSHPTSNTPILPSTSSKVLK